MKKNRKYTVNGVLINEQGNILCVSRKDNHEQFGLVGGKVDPEDFETSSNFYTCLENAIKRETLEETGLEIYDLELIFNTAKYDSIGFTFLCKYKGEINTDEPHVVKWGDANDLLEGPFSSYNILVLKSLGNLKVNHL